MKKNNTGILSPQSFLTAMSGCKVIVNFDFNNKWEEFKVWIEKGNLKQCELDGAKIDVWVRRNTDLYGDSPASLQEHFNSFCHPGYNGYGYATYEVKLK